MSLTDLYIRDKHSGLVHRIGDDGHDMLIIGRDGQLHYQNLQNGDGCHTGADFGGYEFIPNEDEEGYNCDPRRGDPK